MPQAYQFKKPSYWARLGNPRHCYTFAIPHLLGLRASGFPVVLYYMATAKKKPELSEVDGAEKVPATLKAPVRIDSTRKRGANRQSTDGT